MDTYCWIHGTYSIPSRWVGEQVRGTHIHTTYTLYQYTIQDVYIFLILYIIKRKILKVEKNYLSSTGSFMLAQSSATFLFQHYPNVCPFVSRAPKWLTRASLLRILRTGQSTCTTNTIRSSAFIEFRLFTWYFSYCSGCAMFLPSKPACSTCRGSFGNPLRAAECRCWHQ